MRLLLDTHAFLWWVGDDARLSRCARETIGSDENELFLSVASAWEMAVKMQLGRLVIQTDLESFLAEHTRRNAITILPIGLTHAVKLYGLPLHHRDPFDRMLVAQAMAEELTLLTSDRAIRQYDVATQW